ncbi:MAG: hypothetical protein ACE5FG_09355 [Myxococcota bacterium]
MRVEYNFELESCEVPCFSVETTEGPHKLFQLTTLVLNLLDEKERVDIVFHSPNEQDLPKKIETYKQILSSAPHAPKLSFTQGKSGSLTGYYFCWISIRASDEPA